MKQRKDKAGWSHVYIKEWWDELEVDGCMQTSRESGERCVSICDPLYVIYGAVMVPCHDERARLERMILRW